MVGNGCKVTPTAARLREEGPAEADRLADLFFFAPLFGTL